jgi:LacI family transcriptional regulator
MGLVHLNLLIASRYTWQLILKTCYELQIVIPGQLKVISFSNSAVSALFNPPLSCIIQPAYEMGKKATTLLFRMIEKKELLPTDYDTMIRSEIIERGSTDV